MSYSIDRLRAVSLEHADDIWSMEVEELVRINRNTFRPKRRRLRGRDVILQHLALNQGSLVLPTRQILDAPTEADFEVRYEIRGPGWVPAPRMEAVKEDRSADRDRELEAAEARLEQLAKRVHELEGELRAAAERIAHLEQAVASGATLSAPTGDLTGQNGHPPEVAPQVTPEASAAAEAPPEEPAALPEPSFPALQVPASDAVLDLVRGLAGDAITLSKADPAGWVLDGDSQGYLACLKNDDGEVIGALVMDLEATVRLAGGMLMEDVEELDAQVEDRTPSDDVLDAAGEVLNTLTSAVNKTSGNAHVRSGALETVKDTEEAWLLSPRGREDFQFSVGGRLAVVCR